jgi:hypothetical protein
MIDMIIYLMALCQVQQEALDTAEAVIREQGLVIESMESSLRDVEIDIEELEEILYQPI